MTQQRPQRRYRLDFRQLLLGDRPRTVLDVGCGSGSLARWLQKGGVAATGLDPDEAHIAALRAAGYAAHVGRGEELPFTDGAFDVVASEFCAHHFADLARHLREALRVARRAVWLLDPWFDHSLDSQRLTRSWDRWCKRIDRRRGLVHGDALTAADFVAALPGVATDRLEFQHWLRLVPIALPWFEQESAEHVAVATVDELAELAAIRAGVAAGGATDDGAIVVRIAAG